AIAAQDASKTGAISPKTARRISQAPPSFLFRESLPHRALKRKDPELRHPVGDRAVVAPPPGGPEQASLDMIEGEGQKPLVGRRFGQCQKRPAAAEIERVVVRL